MRVLRKGMKGDDVEAWQNFLVGQGHAIEADGDFGNGTFNATSDFQRQNNLDVDGAVGPATMGFAMTKGFNPLEDAAPPANSSANAPPRPNFEPLMSTAERQKLFGAFDFVAAPVPASKENIRILGNWEQSNIVRTTMSQLVGVPGAGHDGAVRFHKAGLDQLVALWKAWDDAGLLNRVLGWGGAFNPRFIRGKPGVLSNHAFGTAFDINVPFNPLGARPALIGKQGSVRELVPIANEHGFFWGGHFGKRPDGMHFEVAVLK